MDDPRRGDPDNEDDDNEDVHISLEEFALSSPIPYGAMKDLIRRQLARLFGSMQELRMKKDASQLITICFLMIVADLLAQKFIIYFKVSLY